MAYSAVWHEKAFEDLKRIDKQVAKKIVERVKTFLVEGPEERGKVLKGSFKGMYRYRFSEYRIIYIIDRPEKVIKIIQVEHRKKVYKSKGKSKRKFE